MPFAVNVSAAEASETVRPFLPIAERLGRLLAGLTAEGLVRLDVEYHGQLADYDTRILTLSVLRGLLEGTTDEPVTYVNAPQIAADRGTEVVETATTTSHDYVNLITLRGGGHSLAGTLVGLQADPRIVMVDDHDVDMPPAGNILIVRNDDRPGAIGRVGMILGEAGVNIADMDVGQTPEGDAALMVLATSTPVPPEVQEQLRSADGINAVHAISLE